MDVIEARYRIIRALPDDFLQDSDNRIALGIMAKAFNQLEEQEKYFKKMFGVKTSTTLNPVEEYYEPLLGVDEETGKIIYRK